MSGAHYVGQWAPSSEMLRARAVVSRAFDVAEADLLSPSRLRHHVLARQAVCYVVRRVWPTLSFPCIAVLVGRGDHSTIIHACRQMATRMRADAELDAKVGALVALLTGKPDLRDHNAHVREWQRARIARIADASRARAVLREREREVALLAAGVSSSSNNYRELVAAGVGLLNRDRKVKPANKLSEDDADALRRKRGSDTLSQAIAAAGGWPGAIKREAA